MNFESLASLMDQADEAGEYQHVALSMIRPDPNQPRQTLDNDTLHQLADSIKAQGVVQPIVVRRDPEAEGGYMIIAGERRWRAAQLAGLAEIPVVVRDLDPHAVLAVQLIENINREGVPPLEEAEAVARLVENLGSQKDTAQALGKGKNWVSLRLGLLKLPEEIQALARAGLTRDAETLDLLGKLQKLDPEACAHFIAHPEEITREVLRNRIKSGKRGGGGEVPSKGGAQKKKGAEAVSKDVDIARLEQDLSERLGAVVRIVYHEGKGSVELRVKCFSLDEFDGVLAHIQ